MRVLVKNGISSSPMRFFWGISLLAVGAILWWTGVLHAEPRDLTDLGMEELMIDQVTSVSEKIRELSDSVITVSAVGCDNLRRSGFISVPDRLHFMPGLHVAHCRHAHGETQNMKFPVIDPASRGCLAGIVPIS